MEIIVLKPEFGVPFPLVRKVGLPSVFTYSLVSCLALVSLALIFTVVISSLWSYWYRLATTSFVELYKFIVIQKVK